MTVDCLVMDGFHISSLVMDRLNVSSLVNDWSVDGALVVALEVMVRWSVRCESLVVGLVVVRGAIIAVLVPLDRLVVHGNLVGRDVVLLSVVHGLGVMTVVIIVNCFVMRLIVVELFLVKGHRVLNMMNGHVLRGVDGYSTFPVLVQIVASVVSVVGHSCVIRLVTVVVCSTVEFALTVINGSGDSGNSSESERSHSM